MNDDKDIRQVIAEKAGLLNGMIQKKFGSNPDAAATGGEENQTGGGSNMTMRVTRSAGSNAPGEVTDGKLVDLKALAASSARSDVPATDLMALARANDPHNENSMPSTIASAVTAGADGLPGQSVEEDHSMDGALGNPIEEAKKQLHHKQHPAVEKAVDTNVESQVSDKDPYKTLHAGAEIDQIVARAKAVMVGADAIRAHAEGKNPGVGKPEDGGQGKAGGDASKDPQASADTLGNGGSPKTAGLNSATSRKDVLAAINAERTRLAKVEGSLEEPAGGGAAQTPEEGAASMGNGGAEKGASVAKKPVVAESKDRPLASMPDHKKRYPADDDGRDEEAASYWAKNKSDEKRFDKEPSADRPLTHETQEKLPSLAAKRQDLITRLAGLSTVLAAEDGEAARLHLKKRTYQKDKPEDMDYAGAAGRTKSEINKEHGQRSSDSGSLSPMMSRLWSQIGPVRIAAEGFKGEIAKPEGKSEMKKQIGEMQKAMKGIKAEDAGAEASMGAMESKIEKMEGDLSKASGVGLGIKSISAIAKAQDRLAVIAAVLGDMGRLCKLSHMECRFALEKPMGSGASDETIKLLEELGETVDDMEGVIDLALKGMGHPGLKDNDAWKKGKPGEDGKPGEEPGAPEGLEPKGPEMGGAELPGMGGGAPAMPDLGMGAGAGTKGAVKTAFEVEDESVAKVAADASLTPEVKKAEIAKLRAGSKWTAAFNKVSSKENPANADLLSSYWEVLRDGAPVLKVSLNDAYPVKTASEQEEAFAWFATKDYGVKLLASAKFEGLGHTAKLLGLTNVRTAAGAFDEYSTKRPAAPAAALEGSKKPGEADYYAKAFGSSEFASELLKTHEKKAAQEKAGLQAKIAALEAEKLAQSERNDRLQADMAMRAKAAKALDLASKAVAKGVCSIEHKANFIDNLMQGDDNSFKLASSMVENFKVAVASAEPKKELTAQELLRIASRGPGLKTPIVSESAGSVDLQGQLGSMWKTPPTAKA